MKNEDAKCVERILGGDEAAFTALVKKYEKQVHAFVWQRVRDYHAAEEITQDTFLRGLRKTRYVERIQIGFRGGFI